MADAAARVASLGSTATVRAAVAAAAASGAAAAAAVRVVVRALGAVAGNVANLTALFIVRLGQCEGDGCPGFYVPD